jgi:hypothetical protein
MFEARSQTSARCGGVLDQVCVPAKRVLAASIADEVICAHLEARAQQARPPETQRQISVEKPRRVRVTAGLRELLAAWRERSGD